MESVHIYFCPVNSKKDTKAKKLKGKVCEGQYGPLCYQSFFNDRNCGRIGIWADVYFM